MKNHLKIITLIAYSIFFSMIVYIFNNQLLFGYKSDNKHKEENILYEFPLYIKPNKIIRIDKDKRGPTSKITFHVSNKQQDLWYKFHQDLSVQLLTAGFSSKTGCRDLEFIMLLPKQETNATFTIQWEYPSNSCQ